MKQNYTKTMIRDHERCKYRAQRLEDKSRAKLINKLIRRASKLIANSELSNAERERLEYWGASGVKPTKDGQ